MFSQRRDALGAEVVRGRRRSVRCGWNAPIGGVGQALAWRACGRSTTSSGAMAWRQNSHISAAVIGWRPPALRPAVVVAACSTIAAWRRGRPGRQQAGGARLLGHRHDVLEQRCVRVGDVGGVGHEEPLGELEEQRLLRHAGRGAQLVEHEHRLLQAVERITVDRDLLDPGDRLAHLLLEQREEQLVLAVEVLVEAAQRLLRPVDDLLHRELGRPLLGDDLAGGVQELLDPDRRSLPSGTGRSFDRTIAPDRVAVRIVIGFDVIRARTGVRHAGTLSLRPRRWK